MERVGARRAARRFRIRPRRIGDRARGPRPRTVARAVPAHRRGGSRDRPLRTRFRSCATTSGTGRREHGRRARPVGQCHDRFGPGRHRRKPRRAGGAGRRCAGDRRGRGRRHRRRARRRCDDHGTGLPGHHPLRRVGRAARRARSRGTVCFAAPRARRGPCSGSWRRPRRSASAGQPWRWPSNTPRCASSSAGPSAPSRPSNTMPPTCW